MLTIKEHQAWMACAIKEAKRAEKRGEVPVGAVLVQDGRVLAQGGNQTRTDRDPTAHAEIVVLRAAAKKIGNERLTDATLYVTLEPCAMCAGAIVQARVPVVVFGALDPKAGACGSVLKVLPNRKLNHRPRVLAEVCALECVTLLKQFFRRKRSKIKKSLVSKRRHS